MQTLQRDNEDIDFALYSIDELQAQIKTARKIEQVSSGVRAISLLIAVAGVHFSRQVAIHDNSRTAMLVAKIFAAGGVVIVGTTSVIVEVQEDKIEDLVIALTHLQAQLETEKAANLAALSEAEAQ